ncbi:MAG: TetR family transcriptional regulator [Herminiimonas sp.]|nr:TetR family transcriptional regulator [Herminiimonas sp.]
MQRGTLMAAATSVPKPAAKAPKRDATATRARLLKVAVAEFATKGYSGARMDAVASRAKVNIRMVYHYFGGKEALYIEVLEHTLAKLRTDELKLDFSAVMPIDGIMQLFDFIDGHFAAHPELMKLLSSENLNKARFMQKSILIPAMATPVLKLLQNLLQRGVADGAIARGIAPLHLYVTLVSLAYFHKSNAHTLSRIFETDLLALAWQADHKAQTRRMLLQFLTPPPAHARPTPRAKQTLAAGVPA